MKNYALLLLLLGLSTIAQAQEPGEYLFRAYCVGCHGDYGRGDGPVAARLKQDFGVSAADLTALKTDRAQLRKAISGGGQAVHRSKFMPAWSSTLAADQVDQLTDYVLGLRGLKPGQEPPTLTPAYRQLDRGRQLYDSHCLACHGPRGEGGGPFLAERRSFPRIGSPRYLDRTTNTRLVEFIQSGIRHAGIEPDKADWWHRPLDQKEQRALIFFLRSLEFSGDATE